MIKYDENKQILSVCNVSRTFCRNQLGVDPELSCRILTCLSLPRSGNTSAFVSFLRETKYYRFTIDSKGLHFAAETKAISLRLFTHFPLEKCLVSSFLNPESPFSPYKVMYTLASVSAPSTSPVNVVTV